MPEQNGETINVSTAASAAGSKGIEQTNQSVARDDETKMTGAVRQSAINKLEARLTSEHPDWPDDRVKAVATRMFEQATSKPTGASSNEGNEDARGPENEMKKAAKPSDEYNDTGIDGTNTTSAPKGLNT
jgi:hypothetical protein